MRNSTASLCVMKTEVLWKLTLKMNAFIEYLTLSLWLAPVYFFICSFLHFRKKIKPSLFYGYSAKGQLMQGVAFAFCASSFLFQSNVGYFVFMLVYCVIFICANKIEKRAKQEWEISEC